MFLSNKNEAIYKIIRNKKIYIILKFINGLLHFTAKICNDQFKYILLQVMTFYLFFDIKLKLKNKMGLI